MGKRSEYTELGAFVVERLREQRRSQRRLAQQLDLSMESFRRWFKRGDHPKLENLEALEDGLGLPRGTLRRFWRPEAELDARAIRHAENALSELFTSHGVTGEHSSTDARLQSGGDKMYTDLRSYLESPDFGRLSRDHRLALALLLRGRDV